MYKGAGEGFTNLKKKNFVAQETIDLNISWPSNFFSITQSNIQI